MTLFDYLYSFVFFLAPPSDQVHEILRGLEVKFSNAVSSYRISLKIILNKMK